MAKLYSGVCASGSWTSLGRNFRIFDPTSTWAFVPKSADSTSTRRGSSVPKFGRDRPARRSVSARGRASRRRSSRGARRTSRRPRVRGRARAAPRRARRSRRRRSRRRRRRRRACADIESSSFSCASRTRREPSIRPRISRIDFDVIELEKCLLDGAFRWSISTRRRARRRRRGPRSPTPRSPPRRRRARGAGRGAPGG